MDPSITRNAPEERRTRSAIMARAGNVLILVAVVLGGMGAGRAADSGPAAREEIQRFVRAYIEANNGADPTAILDMVSRKPEVSMAEMGSINRGWDSIRAELDKLAGTQGTHTVSLGTMDITPLGPGYVLVVASMSVDQDVAGAQGSDVHRPERHRV